MLLPGMGGPAPGQPMPTKVGFTTYAMWVLCFVVVGVCYKLEQNDKPPTKPSLPSGVDRVLPSGAYLMSACSFPTRAPHLDHSHASIAMRRFTSFSSRLQRMARSASHHNSGGRTTIALPACGGRIVGRKQQLAAADTMRSSQQLEA